MAIVDRSSNESMKEIVAHKAQPDIRRQPEEISLLCFRDSQFAFRYPSIYAKGGTVCRSYEVTGRNCFIRGVSRGIRAFSCCMTLFLHV